MTASAVRFCHLNDQKPISQEAYHQGRRLCDQFCSLIAGREDFLRQTRRSPEVHLPQGPWLPGGERYDAYQAVAEGDYAALNNLRLYWQGLAGRPPASFADPGPEVDPYLEMVAHLPEVLHLSPPNAFGESGWLVNGKIVNRDANAHLECLGHLAQSGKLWELRNRTPEFAALRNERWRRPRVLEIGAGFGGLAHHLRTLVPHARYYLVDLPEALLFAAIYLSALWEGDNVLITPDNLADLGKDTPGFTFVPNFLFDDLCATGMECDLAVNAFSLPEMTGRQLRFYCKGVSRVLGRRGVFFEQNRDDGPAGAPGAKTALAYFFRLGLPLQHPALPATHGPAHLWADVPVKPYAWLPTAAALAPGATTAWTPAGDDLPRLIEEGVCGVNVIYYRGAWFGLPQGCGSFDPQRVEKKGYPKMFTANTREELKKAIRAQCG